jgi:hypothetical protein
MSTPNIPSGVGSDYGSEVRRRVSAETKPSFKTTELIIFVVVVIAVLIASAVTDNGDDGQGFGAKSAWLYVTLLTIGYLVSRGLAKSGSRHHEDASNN